MTSSSDYFSTQEYLDGIQIYGDNEKRNNLVFLAKVVLPEIEKGSGFLVFDKKGDRAFFDDIINITKKYNREKDVVFVDLINEDSFDLKNAISEKKILLITSPSLMTNKKSYEAVENKLNEIVYDYVSFVLDVDFAKRKENLEKKKNVQPFLFFYIGADISNVILSCQRSIREVGFVRVAYERQTTPNILLNEVRVDASGDDFTIFIKRHKDIDALPISVTDEIISLMIFLKSPHIKVSSLRRFTILKLMRVLIWIKRKVSGEKKSWLT